MAYQWEQLDGEDDADFALWAAMVAGFDAPTLADRLDAWRPAWMSRAACRGASSRMFFPTSREPAAADEAKAVCSACAVRVECFDFGADHQEQGVWGGTSPAERRALRRAG